LFDEVLIDKGVLAKEHIRRPFYLSSPEFVLFTAAQTKLNGFESDAIFDGTEPSDTDRKVQWTFGPMVKAKRPKDEKPWSTMDVFDLRHAIEQGESIEQTAAVLGRPVGDVLKKAEELGLINRLRKS
jgi:hypothetical protein